MALIFSQVTLQSDLKEIKFFVGGIPKGYSDLKGWTAFDDFMKFIKPGNVNAHVITYLYGSGQEYNASVEEVAYFIKRLKDDKSFLNKHCLNIEESYFTSGYIPQKYLNSI